MELNVTKQTVSMNDLSFNQNVEQGVDFTVNIPDYCGEVQRILKYTLIPRIHSKNINGQTLSIEGSACFSVIFIDENGKISSYECNTPFSKNIDLGANYDCISLCVKPKCGYINAKAITSSRIDVNSVIELSISIFTKKSTEIISDIDCPDVFVNRGEAPATVPINSAEKNMIVEEEIPLSADQPSIYSILRHSSTVSINDTKIVNNKVIAKGELKVKLLYCSTDRGHPQHLSATVPFSQIIDVEGINEDCECDITVEIASLDIKPRSNYEGDVRSVMICAKLCLAVRAVCNNNIAVIFDAYSSKFDTTSENSDTTFEKHINSISEIFACKKSIEFSDGDLGNVIDLWCHAAMQNYKIEENMLHIGGTVTLCMLCENAEGIANYFERPIDFEYRTECGDLAGNLRAEPAVEVLSSQFSVLSASTLELNVELALSASIYEQRKINILTSFSATQNELAKKHSDASMVIYYAEKGELTWNIAKRFNASPEDIMLVNSVDSVIPDNMPIIISC